MKKINYCFKKSVFLLIAAIVIFFNGAVKTSAVVTEYGDSVTAYSILDIKLSADIQMFLQETAQKYGISYALALAVIEQESDFRTDVVGGNNYGLFQINIINYKGLHDKLGVTDLLNPYQNIKCGCYMLGEFQKKYETESTALMAYNCGEAGAKRLWNNNVFETDYTKAVLLKKEKYLKMLSLHNAAQLTNRKEVALMSYYHTCPICGANLDPGERCDCNGSAAQQSLIKGGEGDGCKNTMLRRIVIKQQ